MLTKKSLDDCKKQYLKAKKAYYNGVKPLMTDAAFDKLEDHIRKLDPNWSELHKTGVKVGKKTEVALRHFMPSLNKAYPEDMPKWLGKYAGPYIAMDKLDGSSLQVAYKAGKPASVVTRGDGTLGGDISFLIPHLNLPIVKHKGSFELRCEALMDKKAFTKKWATDFDNSRNAVNGLLNRRTPHPALKDVRIVVLGVFGSSIQDGLVWAASQGFDVVEAKTLNLQDYGAESLTTLLQTRRGVNGSEFEIDGLVVAPSSFKLVYKNADKPKGIIAFKVNDEENAAVVTVKQVIWQVTGRKRIVPKIEIEPTRMDGVMVKHCTAHNAQWMLDRKIGPGAKVKVLRSGGVIPKIVDVVKAGKFQEPTIPYKKDGVHFVVANASGATNASIAILNIVKFMKTLGIELVAGKTASALFQSGLRTPMDYIEAYANKKLGLMISDAGFDGKQGVKIYDEIKRVFDNPISMKKLMVATQIFGVGIGERKLTQIEDFGISMDQLNSYRNFALGKKLLRVPGFSEKTIQIIEDGWAEWLAFYAEASKVLTIDGSLPKKKKAVAGKLSGQKVSFTGFRDAGLEAKIEAAGGEIVTFGSKTTLLVYKADGKASTKVATAEEKGIKTVELSKFKI